MDQVLRFQRLVCVALVILFGDSFSCGAEKASAKFGQAVAHIKSLPDAPSGYRWAVNPDFTDEFDGKVLDESKWFRKSPYWTNGRPPATFKTDNVSLWDGCLRIRNRRLDPPEGKDGKPGDTYTLAGGAVASKSDQAWYGYYEVKMKASPTPMSSTFWLKNQPRKVRYLDPDGNLIVERHVQELDVIETIGRPTNPATWNERFNANTHYFLHKEGRRESESVSSGAPRDERSTICRTTDDFHTYGVWWVDPNTMHFYYDGEFRFTVHPATDYNPMPFARQMYIHMVTETYDWEPSRPTEEMLTDDPKFSTLYDWVRAYVLVKDLAKEN